MPQLRKILLGLTGRKNGMMVYSQLPSAFRLR